MEAYNTYTYTAMGSMGLKKQFDWSGYPLQCYDF